MKPIRLFSVVALSLVAAMSSFAGLLGVNPTYPLIAFNSVNNFALSYNSTSQVFSVVSTPGSVVFSGLEAARPVLGVRSVNIQVIVNSAGVLVGGVPGNDLTISGTVSRIVSGVTNTYTGVLLTGEVTAFGSADAGVTDVYDLRFTPTGGALAGFFCGNIGVTLASEFSTFTGGFTSNFNGRGKGNAGSEDLVAPTIVCPANIIAECHTTNSMTGAYVSYPTPTVSDNCDSNPTIVCTPPSGSFFSLPHNLASTNYVVTCVVTDSAGNTNTCSFTITVQDTLPPEFADPTNPVIQSDLAHSIVLTNDPGKCYATFKFPKPLAVDNCCPLIITTMVSAVDENGNVIVLTDLGNGFLQGQFPVNVSGSNVITITADDGRGNTTQHQTAVVVVDRDPPVIACVNQTGTFKPILTNALSCIEADFDDDCIKKSNVIWFSSVIKIPSCSYSGAFTVHIFDQSIELAIDGTNIVIPVPEAYITFSNGVTTATTTFTNGMWITLTKRGLSGNVFAAAVAWTVPFDLNNNNYTWGCRNWRDRDEWFCKRRRVNSATWCGRFDVDKPNIAVQWQWSAGVLSSLTNKYNECGVKPCDDNNHSKYKNSDAAGSCQKYKKCAVKGGRGKGKCGRDDDDYDCTGVLSDCKRANLGLGTVCLGPVEFNLPTAIDNCGNVVPVVCDPDPGSIFGPGVYPITATATDASGNTSTCTFNLTVLTPLQVVFDSPACDNVADNTSEPDEGFSDMNCPDADNAAQCVTRFCPGDTINHTVRLLDCNGDDVTCAIGPFVSVHIDVTERKGTYSNSVLISDVPQNFVCVGSPGALMVLNNCCQFRYNLSTSGYESGTVYNDKFFRSCVWVDYNSSPGVVVGMEDVILDSR